jgi:hypothetical protein
MRRAFRLFAFAASGGGVAACALVSGLTDYSLGAVDAGTPVTKPPDAQGDAPAAADDGPSADDVTEDRVMFDDGSDGAPSDDADAETDGRPTEDVDAHEGGGVEDAEGGGPPPDANDGGPPPDANDGCVPVVHSNGVGQTYTDCVPLNTYGPDEAAKACAATNVGTCGQNTVLCIGGPTIECTLMAGTCTCWSYTGPTAGRVDTSKAGALCACPAPTDPMWH